MPRKIKKICMKPGCREITENGYCDKHKIEINQRRREYFDRRESANSRGYDARWQKVRLFKLAKDGLCEMCYQAGHIERASLVHHIKPISSGGAVLDYENLMSLCDLCHRKIHGVINDEDRNGKHQGHCAL